MANQDYRHLVGGRKIVKAYCAKELEGKRIDDFLPRMESSAEDQQILNSWMHHFRTREIPFIVTEEIKSKVTVFKLWKEQYIKG